MQPSGLVMSWFVVSLYLVHGARFTDAWQHSTGYVFCRVRWPVSVKVTYQRQKMSSHCSQFTVAQHTVQPRRRKHRVVSNDFGSGACQKPAHHYQMIKHQANPICGNASLRSLMDFLFEKAIKCLPVGEKGSHYDETNGYKHETWLSKSKNHFSFIGFWYLFFTFSASKSICLNMINKMLAFTC